MAHTTQRCARRCVHILRYSRSGSNEDGIKSLLKKAVNGVVSLAHERVTFKVYAQSCNLFYLGSYHFLGQTIFRNAIHQHTSRLILPFKNRNIETNSCQIARHSEPRWPRTNHSYLATALLWQWFSREIHLRIEVSYKLFYLAYLDRFILFVEHTMPLTLLFVWTNTPTDGRKIALFVDNPHGIPHISHGQGMDKLRNIILNRATFSA